MALNAQQLITLSIGKITGSRSQRGGINLRKNLLVASVLHSARAFYYEEMCNRMDGNISLESSDCAKVEKSKDWEDNITESSTENTTESPACEEIPRVAVSCERCLGEDTVDKENNSPMEVSVQDSNKIENNSCDIVEDRLHENVENTDRGVLQDCTAYENNTKMAVNITVTVECTNVSESCKRKREVSETEEACENILPKKAKLESSTESTYIELKSENTSNISSLVNIFRSSLHGLSGEGDNSNSFNSQSQIQLSSSTSNHLALQQSSYGAPISRTFDSISTPIAAC